jgi:glycerol-3-phosphate dehydrogenase (NAD(P)+)
MKISLLGSGQWGTALAQVLVDGGHEVLLWGRNAEVAQEINSSHRNSAYLGPHLLPENLYATSNIDEAFDHAEAIVLAIPSQSLRNNLIQWSEKFPKGIPVISSLKGIELSTHLRMTEVVNDVLAISHREQSVITGPNLAMEIILRQPAGAVAASINSDLADLTAELFSREYFRVYTSLDPIGCELAAAAKNVIALAVGISIGMGYGENTQALVITRGLNEVTRLGIARGAMPLTFVGLAGVGDLLATCGSPLSRNRSFGEVLGRTGSMASAMAEVISTVEGVTTASAIVELAHHVGVEAPIMEAVADVVSHSITPSEAIARLMSVHTGAEIE